MLRKLLLGCRHKFSWPLKLPGGTYYQVCVRCGIEYGYDWQRMHRTKVIRFRKPEPPLEQSHSQKPA
jgi:hypothetical protein